MAAPNGYPSYVYNSAAQPAIIVTSAAQFAALQGPGVWSATPYPPQNPPAPVDTTPVLTVTDTRLQQILVEQRTTNQMLQIGLNIMDDPATQIRPDIIANDSSLSS